MKLPKVYEPEQYEADIYTLWEQSGVFAPKEGGEPYAIAVPPPNANGNLHLGHALTIAIEDCLVRYHRLQGKNAVLLPGADHAGFETQVVYEKQLEKEGKSRFDFSRDSLYKQVFAFVGQNRANFEQQFRRLGAGVDWQHLTFSLDEKVVIQAYKTFKQLWDEGLIYRGERLVNYCTFHRTGFADIEVEYENAKTPLYYLKYGPFILATTRPETKFGDTAVAVHPDDKRYKDWVGKTVTVEGVNGPFEVRVVADKMVDPKFGTGAVKVTPAHSFDDWEVAQRHNLPAVRVINHDGTMNHHAGRFEGMTVLEARKAVVEAMKEQGLLEKVDDTYENRVGKCYKCGTVIEPMLMEQWFLQMEPLAKPAIKALKGKKITFYPDSKREQLVTYLENLRDWNLSRQIAWGIPIPAFQNVDDDDDWIYDERVDQEIIEVDGKTYHRDPDVFDTWFSSSSWPYVATAEPELQGFYPLSVMETGFDILYPWVSRMIMFGLKNTGKLPFEVVYLHGLILDEHGAKMSKSKGNVVNPLEIVDGYGSDALRMGILSGQTPGNNQPFGLPKVVGARNFCNKLWNIARFIEDALGEDFKQENPAAQTPADHWILTKLQQTQSVAATYMEGYRLSEAYETLYHFIWDDLADWYIEASKTTPNKPLLAWLLESTLIMLHPFAPFVTETIWQTLAWEKDSVLAARRWPEGLPGEPKPARDFEELCAIVTEARFIMKALQASGVTLYHKGDRFLTENAELISRLARLKSVELVESGTGIYLTETSHSCWLDIDVTRAKQYVVELQKKHDAQAAVMTQLAGRLQNKSYVEHAPAAVVEQSRQQLADAKTQLEKIEAEIKRFRI
jgi:valyl-tRNA synthetase